MKVALLSFGTGKVTVKDIEKNLPDDTTVIEIASTMEESLSFMRYYAPDHFISFSEAYPNYDKYGDEAPKRCLADVIIRSDLAIAFWDGESNDIIFARHFCEYVCVHLKVCII